jgi:hypothetical protein
MKAATCINFSLLCHNWVRRFGDPSSPRLELFDDRAVWDRDVDVEDKTVCAGVEKCRERAI